ncbi:hypothetical protein [Streptomyces sp. NPDC002402]
MTRSIEHKGYDPGPELRGIEGELRALYADKDARKSRTGRMIWQEEVDLLERRAAALESTPRTDARTEVIETGETFAQHWQALEPVRPAADEDVENPTSVRAWETYRVAMAEATQERRALLLKAGARVYVAKGRCGGGTARLEGPDESRLRFIIEEAQSAQCAQRNP